MVDGGEYVVAFRMDLMDGVELESLRRAQDEVQSNAITLWRDAPVRARVDWDALNAPVATEASLGFTNCSSSQQSGVSSAVNAATNYSTGAKNYLSSKTYNTVGPRYTTWFGAVDSGRFNTVKSHFVAIEDAFLTKPVVVDCSCTQSYYAYVYPTQPYKIYVCKAFWSANNTGTDSRAGTLVHEMSHFNVVASTDDWAYGQSACKKLAKRAAKAVDNADSHEYFAENTPPLN
jgi:peptidyl-Lys metalloendopeptidase